MRIHRRIKVIIAFLMLLLISGCNNEIDQKAGEEAQTITTEWIKQETIEQETENATETVTAQTPLEEFGDYFASLLENRERDKLEEYTISRTLTLEEASALATTDPAFAHFEGYDKYQFFSDGVIIVSADINQDGHEDIIEYCPRICYGVGGLEVQEYSLTIYKGAADGSYQLLYSQPNFIFSGSWDGKITVIHYGKEIFVLFNHGPNNSWMDLNMECNVYWIKGENIIGELCIADYWERMDATIVQCKEEYLEEAENIKKYNREFVEEYTNIITGDKPFENYYWGSAEKDITETEYCDKIYNSYYTKMDDIKRPHQEKNKDMELGYITKMGKKEAFSGDINNDGKEEFYFKGNSKLGFSNWLPILGPVPFVTGDLYGNGRHEGKRGLIYHIEMNGQSTDFEKMCGLDIWSGSLTPQVFWIDKVRGTNITYILYSNEKDEYQINGYHIEGDTYEQVLSVESVPVIKVMPNPTYTYKEEGEYDNLSYNVYMVYEEKIGYIEVYGLEDKQLQDTINGNIRFIIGEEIKKIQQQGAEVRDGARFRVRESTESELVLEYVGIYEVIGYWEYESEIIYFTVDMTTGTCKFLREKPEMEERSW